MSKELKELMMLIMDYKCSSTKLQIGYTVNGYCKHDGFVIQESCQAIVRLAVNQVEKCDHLFMNMTADGLLITDIRG